MPLPLKKRNHREISFSVPEGHDQAITAESANVANVFPLQSVSYSCSGVGFVSASCASICKRHSCHKSLHHTSAWHHIAGLTIWWDKVFSCTRKHVHKPLKNGKKSANKVNLLPEGFSWAMISHRIGSAVINRILKKNQLSLLYFSFDVSHPGLSVSSSAGRLVNALHHTLYINSGESN